MRLFIAVDIPENIKKVLASLKVDIPGARWVPVEQIHLTLAFLGEVDEATTARLIGELSHIQAPVFEICFSGTGCFPDRRRPRVLWIGLAPVPRLNALAAKVRDAVLDCGITQEERPFSPHITLTRLKTPASRESSAFLGQHEKLKLPLFSVCEFTLFESRLTPQGAMHIPLKSFALAPAKASGEL